MKTKQPLALLLCSAVLTSCAVVRQPAISPLSWEFGREQFLTAEYLMATPGAVCEQQDGQLHLFAPLPDSSYFLIQVRPSSIYPEPWVRLRRGGPTRYEQVLTLNPVVGIVEGFDRGKEKTYGIRTFQAQWLAELGREALTVDCAAR